MKSSAALVLIAASAQGATLVNNGDFENWPSTNPAGWTLGTDMTTTKVTGLDGGNAVALGLSGTSTEASIRQTLTSTVGPASPFSFSIDFLQDTVSASTSDRGFNVTLRNSGTTILNFAVFGSQLNATSGSTFGVIGDATLTADNWYRLVVTGTIGTGGSYSVELYDLTGGSSTAIISETGITRWQTTPNNTTTINEVRLERGRSVTDWTADNVIVAIPEPSALALASTALAGLAFRRRR